jgi:hypothetical protein
MGILKLASKATWKTGKFAVKRVVLPLAYTAAWAAAISWAADKLREDTPRAHGKVDPVIKPER